MTIIKKQPKFAKALYVPLFNLLKNNKNNWALIKLVKLVRKKSYDDMQ